MLSNHVPLPGVVCATCHSQAQLSSTGRIRCLSMSCPDRRFFREPEVKQHEHTWDRSEMGFRSCTTCGEVRYFPRLKPLRR